MCSCLQCWSGWMDFGPPGGESWRAARTSPHMQCLICFWSETSFFFTIGIGIARICIRSCRLLPTTLFIKIKTLYCPNLIHKKKLSSRDSCALQLAKMQNSATAKSAQVSRFRRAAIACCSFVHSGSILHLSQSCL